MIQGLGDLKLRCCDFGSRGCELGNWVQGPGFRIYETKFGEWEPKQLSLGFKGQGVKVMFIMYDQILLVMLLLYILTY